jgi:2-polyprenyl-3-methyl-5-hydroxy-6-metoxy-1,4-benzoquinol methylase
VNDFLEGDLAVAGGFDGLLVAHVIEHLDRGQALDLLRDYLSFVRPGGRVFLVCPQERGYAYNEFCVAATVPLRSR